VTTRWKISEQIIRLLNGGSPSAPSWMRIPELYEAIGQVLNKLVKLDHVTLNLGDGERIPSEYCMGTYDNIPVVQYKNQSKCTLPAIPIALPRDIGLFSIHPMSLTVPSNFLNSQFIPIPPGHSVLLAGQPMINTLLGQVGYERRGRDVIFYTDITVTPYQIGQVSICMVVLDMTQYGDYDLLPIPADMEADCVAQVYNLFKGERPPDKVDDPISIPVRQ
jgi:hypothetical protein